MSIYSFTVHTATGQEQSLADYSGRIVLIVNTASRCGLTPQYQGLQHLYEQYHELGLDILAFPCNQFAGQEPGTNEEIAQFCELNYHVTFPIFAKIKVNGNEADPLYRYLTHRARGVFGSVAIKWNFTKFLIGRDGEVIRRFGPQVPPDKLSEAIQALL